MMSQRVNGIEHAGELHQDRRKRRGCSGRGYRRAARPQRQQAAREPEQQGEARHAQQEPLPEAILADPKGEINLSLGIRDEQYPVGSAAFGVPRPTLYVLDNKGAVRLRYMEPTYKTRPDLETVLRDIEALAL